MLVTGGAGFVGSRLCSHLSVLGHDVLVLDRRKPSSDVDSDAVDADVRDAAAVERALRDHDATAVIHLAAIHFIPDCEADPVECHSVNVDGTDSVLAACARAGGVQRVVCASTAAVYEPCDERHTEDSPLGPTDAYGRSRLEGERLLERFHRESGIAVAVARLFNVFGPGETNPHLIPAILRQALAGNELRLGNLHTRRDYVYVDDVASALASMLDLDRSSLTCNIGSERDVNGFEVVATVGQLLNRHLEVRTDPARFRASDRPRLATDCRRARELLGWSPRTALREGLREALRQPMAQTP